MRLFLVIVSVFSICSTFGNSNLNNFEKLSFPKEYSKIIYLNSGVVFIK